MILLIEDEVDILNNLKDILEQNNYQVLRAKSIKESKKYLEKNLDLIILDVTLPDGDGFEFYKMNIKEREIPTIFLTAKDLEDDIVKGLSLGAEDYITKPFLTKELLIRIKKIIDRHNKANIIKIKEFTFDTLNLRVFKNNMEIRLTSLETRLLFLLINNLNKTITREILLEYIWEWTGNDVNDNTLTVYFKRIREKLDSSIIITYKGIGYRINEER
jgi:phosphate regulon transcriptional regulatory protein